MRYDAKNTYMLIELSGTWYQYASRQAETAYGFGL